ncbi:MAG: NAD-dependent epimerase/dehydratase family protein [Pseudomonadales bacterium]|nr:NAD-dependent epimerase/dehydratase family protein [Pseudomonadales bacterium]
MNVLILGVNGFLGRAIARSAANKGNEVFGLSRSQDPSPDSGITYVEGNRGDLEYVLEIIRNHKIDVLVDVIAMTLQDSRALINAVDGQIGQYILISSSDVYRNYELFQKKSLGIPNQEAVQEDSELRQTRYPYRDIAARAIDSPDSYLDHYDKIPIENAAMEMSSQWTILRLPMVYGAGDKQRRFRWAIKPMIDGNKNLVIPTRWANWYSTYGYIDNVADGISLAIGNANAENRVFNIGENQSISQFEWAKRIAEVIGWRGDLVLTDESDDPFAQRVAHLDLSVPFRISSSRIREELGYKEAVRQVDALARTVTSEGMS